MSIGKKQSFQEKISFENTKMPEFLRKNSGILLFLRFRI